MRSVIPCDPFLDRRKPMSLTARDKAMMMLGAIILREVNPDGGIDFQDVDPLDPGCPVLIVPAFVGSWADVLTEAELQKNDPKCVYPRRFDVKVGNTDFVAHLVYVEENKTVYMNIKEYPQ
jgi:hypothetical protein